MVGDLAEPRVWQTLIRHCDCDIVNREVLEYTWEVLDHECVFGVTRIAALEMVEEEVPGYVEVCEDWECGKGEELWPPPMSPVPVFWFSLHVVVHSQGPDGFGDGIEDGAVGSPANELLADWDGERDSVDGGRGIKEFSELVGLV